jgi:hypothetical protein
MARWLRLALLLGAAVWAQGVGEGALRASVGACGMDVRVTTSASRARACLAFVCGGVRPRADRMAVQQRPLLQRRPGPAGQA